MTTSPTNNNGHSSVSDNSRRSNIETDDRSERRGKLLRPFNNNEEKKEEVSDDELLFRQARLAAEEAKLLTTKQLKSGSSSTVSSSGTVYIHIQSKNLYKKGGTTSPQQTTEVSSHVLNNVDDDDDNSVAASRPEDFATSAPHNAKFEIDRRAVLERAREHSAERKRVLLREEEERRLLPERALAVLLNDFRDRTKRYCRAAAKLHDRRAALNDRAAVAVKCARLASHFRAQAEAQRASASEQDDAARAERLTLVVGRYESERKKQEKAAKRLHDEKRESDAKIAATRRRVAECFSYVGQRLIAFRSEHELVEREDESEIQENFLKTSRKLSDEQTKLDKEYDIIERDESVIKKERENVEKEISADSRSTKALYDETKLKLDNVNKEIAELKEKLATKEAVASYITRDLDGYDNKLAAIRNGYGKRLERVTKEEESVRKSKDDHRFRSSVLRVKKDGHDAEVQEHADALLQNEKLVKRVADNVAVARRTEEAMLAEQNKNAIDRKKDNDEKDDDERDARLQNELVKYEAAVAEARSVASSAGDVVGTLRAEADALDAKVSTLENEKKIAVESRDFKTAGRVSKELRSLSRKREILASDTDRLVRAEERLSELEAELAYAKSEAEAFAREKGRRIMTRAATELARLQKRRRALNVDDNDGDRTASVASVAAFVVDAQSEILMAEGRTVGEKYGGWEDALKEAGYDLDGEGPLLSSSRPSIEKRKDAGVVVASASNDDRDVRNLKTRLATVRTAVEEAVRNEDYETAAALEEEATDLETRVQKTRNLLTRFQQQLEETETALETAVSNEDFESAERLESKLKWLQSRLSDANDEEEEEDADEDEEEKKEEQQQQQDQPLPPPPSVPPPPPPKITNNEEEEEVEASPTTNNEEEVVVVNEEEEEVEANPVTKEDFEVEDVLIREIGIKSIAQ